MSKQFLAPKGSSAECVQISVMSTRGLQGAGFEAPKAWEAQNVILISLSLCFKNCGYRDIFNFVGFWIIPKFEGL